MKENKELLEKYAAAYKRLAENKDMTAVDVTVKAAAELGFTITVAELERAMAVAQEVSEEDLAKVSGGSDFDLKYDLSGTLPVGLGTTPLPPSISVPCPLYNNVNTKAKAAALAL